MSVRISLRDRFRDVAIELRSQMTKTVLLLLATALSIGALIASVSISQNAAYQIDADLAASTIRHVTVTAAEASISSESSQSSKTEQRITGNEDDPDAAFYFPKDTQQRIEAVDNVEDAGIMLAISQVFTPTVSRPVVGIINADDAPDAQDVYAASSGYLRASGIDLIAGDPSLLDTNLDVAYLSPTAAEDLGIPTTADTTGASFTIDGDSFSVAGFLPENTIFDDGVVIPFTLGTKLARSNITATVLIETALGAGAPISHVARLAIMPQSPESLTVSQVVSAQSARDDVSEQLTVQASWVGIFLVFLSSLLIANSMIVAVTARTTEIGVRRALGSSKSAVASVFWLEGAIIGFLGGLAGSAIASWAVVGIAYLSDWTARIDPLLVAVGPVLGTTVGLIASLHPSLRAARIHPAIAVRSN